MSDYFTTEELADFLRVKSRKIYDMVSKEEIPYSKVTGKLLFLKTEISSWISGSSTQISNLETLPTVLLGSHDPLLELAIKKSNSGIAMSFDGSTQGIERFKLNEGFASGLHLYDYEQNIWNVPIIKKHLTHMPVVLMEWAQRERGLIFKDRNKNKNITLDTFKGQRLVRRQIGSGAEQYLNYIFKTQNLTYDDFQETEIAYSENDAVTLILSELADLTLGLKSEAVKYNLSFIPLVTERFDLVINRKFWFEKPFQDLLEFCKTENFKIIASKLEGYNIHNLGKIHFNS
tara:strand:- start:1375 stop:2241 length:867 start_codon:yes stop_codon:yes gene_type:complete